MKLSLLLTLLVVAVSACAYNPKAPSIGERRINSYFAAHKDAAKTYTYIRVANWERYLDMAKISNIEKQAILGLIAKRVKDNGELTLLIEHIAEAEQKHLDRITQEFSSLVAQAGVDGVLCEYAMGIESDREWGFLILRDGKVVKKIPWVSVGGQNQPR